MKRMLGSWFAIVSVSTMSACAPLAPREDDHTIAATRATGALEGRPTLGMPIAIPGRTTCLVPYSVETRKRWFEDRDPHTAAGFIGDAWYIGDYLREASLPGGPVRWHNAIFSDDASGEQWMVLAQ